MQHLLLQSEAGLLIYRELLMFLMTLYNTDVKECTWAMKKRVRGRSLLGLDRSSNCLRVILALIILSTPSASSSNNGFRLFTNRNLKLTTQKYVSFPNKRRYCAPINLYANHLRCFNSSFLAISKPIKVQ